MTNQELKIKIWLIIACVGLGFLLTIIGEMMHNSMSLWTMWPVLGCILGGAISILKEL